MPFPPLATTSSLDWRYTAEGGANLVVSCAGAPDSPFQGHVLRLRKRKVGTGRGGLSEAVPSEVEVDFGERIITPLLGRDSVVDMQQVRLDRGWLKELVQAMRDSRARPASRELEDEVDVDAPIGVLAEDLIHGNGVIAVELKPKWGFLPSQKFLSPETAETKSLHCRTCMHRYYKAQLSADTEVSEYEGFCPLDLYSAEEARVRLALEQLYRSWESTAGSFNNLRVFFEGKRVSPDELASPSHPIRRSLARACSLPASSTPCDLLTGALLPPLLSSPLLETLSRLQASLGPLDIEGLAALVLAHPSTRADLFAPPDRAPAEVAKLGTQPSLAEWESFLARISPALRRGRDETARVLQEGEPRNAVLAYLLSATLKDCSVILRIPPPGCGAPSVKAIDLDPKPIARMAKYARMDAEIVRCWKARLEGLSEEDRAKIRRCRL